MFSEWKSCWQMQDEPKQPLKVDLLRDQILDRVRRSGLPLMARLEARTIRQPSGYAPPAIVAAGMAVSLRAAWPGYPLPQKDFDSSMSQLVLAAREAVLFDCPRYFVGPELVEACEQTQLEVGAMCLSDVSWPLGFMAFMLPLGMIGSPSDEDVLYCGFAVVGEAFGEIGGIQMAFRIQAIEPSVVFFAQARSGTFFTSLGRMSQSVMDVTEGAWDPGLGEAVKEMAPGVSVSTMTGRVSRAADDKAFLARVVALVVRIVLAINSAPELREDGAIVKPRKVSKGRVHAEEWSPNFIGRHFQIEKAVSTAGDPSNRVRRHFRRGHYRRQPFGPGLTLVKTIWIRPILVGL